MSYESCGILILNILGIWGGKPKMDGIPKPQKGNDCFGKTRGRKCPGFSPSP